MDINDIHNLPRMLERFYDAYGYCLKNTVTTFQLPREAFSQKPPTEQTFIKVDFDDMIKYGLLIGYHRSTATPYSFTLTKLGFNIGSKIDIHGIEIVSKEFCEIIKHF